MAKNNSRVRMYRGAPGEESHSTEAVVDALIIASRIGGDKLLAEICTMIILRRLEMADATPPLSVGEVQLMSLAFQRSTGGYGAS